jgi:hypothetical protein
MASRPADLPEGELLPLLQEAIRQHMFPFQFLGALNALPTQTLWQRLEPRAET